jgi:hypothetical protein
MEVDAFRVRIQNTNHNLVEALLSDQNSTERVGVDSLKKRLEGFRKDYISKKKELRQKQRQLDELQDEQRQKWRLQTFQAKKKTDFVKQEALRTKTVPSQPLATDAPGISPVLEKRLSGIDQKLDQVLEELEDLKRDKS